MYGYKWVSEREKLKCTNLSTFWTVITTSQLSCDSCGQLTLPDAVCGIPSKQAEAVTELLRSSQVALRWKSQWEKEQRTRPGSPIYPLRPGSQRVSGAVWWCRPHCFFQNPGLNDSHLSRLSILLDPTSPSSFLPWHQITFCLLIGLLFAIDTVLYFSVQRSLQSSVAVYEEPKLHWSKEPQDKWALVSWDEESNSVESISFPVDLRPHHLHRHQVWVAGIIQRPLP